MSASTSEACLPVGPFGGRSLSLEAQLALLDRVTHQPVGPACDDPDLQALADWCGQHGVPATAAQVALALQETPATDSQPLPVLATAGHYLAAALTVGALSLALLQIPALVHLLHHAALASPTGLPMRGCLP